MARGKSIGAPASKGHRGFGRRDGIAAGRMGAAVGDDIAAGELAPGCRGEAEQAGQEEDMEAGCFFHAGLD